MVLVVVYTTNDADFIFIKEFFAENLSVEDEKDLTRALFSR
jgi:hypothetical protein